MGELGQFSTNIIISFVSVNDKRQSKMKNKRQAIPKNRELYVPTSLRTRNII